MQAVRLARYHTGRSHLVRFCGAYHGWWGDVQPGIGNPVRARDTHTLKEMDEATLRVLRRRRDIACVLVNPLQALHPNVNAPGDSSLVDSSRRAAYSRESYTRWLIQLRKICDERGIALIFDEVFVGFRLAPGGAQEYFGVRADLVTYGKTLGGGLPIGVVCGKHAWMKRFRDNAPADICFARGTFNSHPYVMGAMNAFLRRLDIDFLQVTEALVRDARSDSQPSLLSATVGLARALRLGVIFRGVSDTEQLALLSQFEGAALQGALLAAPLSEHDSWQWLDGLSDGAIPEYSGVWTFRHDTERSTT